MNTPPHELQSTAAMDEEDLAAMAVMAEELYALIQPMETEEQASQVWWCDECNQQMDFCQDSFMYACSTCGRTVAIQGDTSAAGFVSPDHNKVRVSKTTGRVYIETQRHTVVDRVREDFAQINTNLGGRINHQILEEAIQLTVRVRGKSVFRKETRWGVPAACLRAVCRQHGVGISDVDILAACKIKNGAMAAGKKRIKEVDAAGHLDGLETGDNVDEASRKISMMLRQLGIEKPKILKAALRLVELDRSSRHARQIQSRCAGAIWYIVKTTGLDVSEEKMQLASGISMPTLNEVYKNITEAMQTSRLRAAAVVSVSASPLVS